MFSESAALYDTLYSEKDYDAESAYVAEVIHGRVPAAATLLDVACGTGEHARRFADAHGFRTVGIDVDPALVSLARQKLPSATFSVADMTDFDLGATYDAVVCLFSSIGYVRTVANLRHTMIAMARHMAPNGVMIVEPWFEPGVLEDGHVTCIVRERPTGPVCRMSHTEIDGRLSRLHFEYLVGAETGLERLSETHELGLFSRDEMMDAFRGAGLMHVTMDITGPTERGLYIAMRT
jgi:ubiquinone/menaquinone biosynthesis C-methylase UbiE